MSSPVYKHQIPGPAAPPLRLQVKQNLCPSAQVILDRTGTDRDGPDRTGPDRTELHAAAPPVCDVTAAPRLQQSSVHRPG